MEFIENRPIYIQLMDIIINKIISGEVLPGEKLLAVREMATELMVNPNTVQRAYQELERLEIVHSERGRGRFVTKNEGILSQIKNEKVHETISIYVSDMHKLGFTDKEALDKIESFVKEKCLDKKGESK